MKLYHVLLSLRAHGWTRNFPQENQLSNKSDDWSDYEVHQELKNADYLHENVFFVGNSQADLKDNIKYLKEILEFIPRTK